MVEQKLEQKEIDSLRKALRKKNRAQVELNMLMCNLEDKYEFSIEAGDSINLFKGMIIYARTNNPVKPMDTE